MEQDSKKLKRMILLMIALVVISVTLTALVVIHMMSKETINYPTEQEKTDIFDETEEADTEITLKNVYITDCSDRTVRFLYQGKPYALPGELPQDYTGIADIVIVKKRIRTICLKRTTIEGRLLSYNREELEIEGYGVLARDDGMCCYSIEGGAVGAATEDLLAVGEQRYSYVIAEGQVCAVLKEEQQEKTDADTIRVLIKNGEQAEYESLYLTASGEWQIDGQTFPAGEAVNMTEYLMGIPTDIVRQTDEGMLVAAQVKTAQVSCGDGFLYLADTDGTKKSEGYEGTFFVREAENGVVLINELFVEDYVRYVLPSEMEDYFPYEAQKVQAVCARTFAYAQMNNPTYAAYGANVDDSTAFQVYNRFGTTELTDRAVRETEGEIIVCGGEPIICYYYSTSPGFTETTEVWEEENPAFIAPRTTLLAKKDYADSLNKKASFIDFIRDYPKSYDDKSPFFRWKATLDVRNGIDGELGRIVNLAVSRRSKSGYALAFTVTYENGSRVIADENEMRKFLGNYLTVVELSDGTCRDNLAMLPSACFIVWEKEGDVYTLLGGGFGHGIGLSQFAAGAMAEQGMDYKEIIDFFYENIEICKK